METELRLSHLGTARRKGRQTDMLNLKRPRHTPTLRIPAGWSRRKADTADCAVYLAIGREARLKRLSREGRECGQNRYSLRVRNSARVEPSAGTTFRGRIVIEVTVQG